MAAAPLDIASHNSEAAPAGAVAGGADSIEKIAEFSVRTGQALGHPSLVGLTRDELKGKLAELGVPERQLKMRVAQLWHWIYFRGIQSFGEMSNVGKGLREALAAAFTLERPQVVSE